MCPIHVRMVGVVFSQMMEILYALVYPIYSVEPDAKVAFARMEELVSQTDVYVHKAQWGSGVRHLRHASILIATMAEHVLLKMTYPCVTAKMVFWETPVILLINVVMLLALTEARVSRLMGNVHVLQDLGEKTVLFLCSVKPVLHQFFRALSSVFFYVAL